MTDDFLLSIDADLACRHGQRPEQRRTLVGRKTAVVPPPQTPPGEFIDRSSPDDGQENDRLWGPVTWMDAYVAVQFLWGAVLFIPGVQQYRGYVRALPYLASGVMLVLYAARSRHLVALPRGASLIISALLLLALSLLHPESQLYAGIAQCVFQLTIAAPLFWTPGAVRTPAALERALVLIFVLNAASAVLGVLQVYSPERFMPPEFSALGQQMNQYYVSALTYIGSDGRAIIRPPGLSDQPGAAALAGALTAIVGFGLLLRRRNPIYVVAILAAITVGFAAIYFSQVRSTLLATIGASALLAMVALRRGRFAGAGWVALAGGTIVVASFLWASSVGGSSVSRRFGGLQGTGAIDAYRSGRGIFVTQTLGELLDRYPFGAGVGRWGMMNVYFGGDAVYESAPIYVEIQPTGWLLDGGILMWLFYGGATLVAMWKLLALTRSPDGLLAELSIIALAVNAYVLALALSSPVFNSQMGILFWTVVGALHGAEGGVSVEPND